MRSPLAPNKNASAQALVSRGYHCVSCGKHVDLKHGRLVGSVAFCAECFEKTQAREDEIDVGVGD